MRVAKPSASRHGGFRKLRGYLYRGPQKKDYSLVGVYWGPLILGNYHILSNNFAKESRKKQGSYGRHVDAGGNAGGVNEAMFIFLSDPLLILPTCAPGHALT